MRYLAFITIALVLSVVPAMGGAITGEQFVEKCAAVKKVNRVPVSEAETVYATFCLGYITGFIDHYDLLSTNRNLRHMTFCLSNSDVPVTNTRLVEIILDYLKKNPQDTGLPVSQTVSLALKEAYPCID